MVRDPQSGQYRRTRLFVLTLGYSRKSVRLLSWRSSERTWAGLHEKAFRRLGGCTRVVVLDNLIEGVAIPDIYDPAINPLSVLTGCYAIRRQPVRSGLIRSIDFYKKTTGVLKNPGYNNDYTRVPRLTLSLFP